MVVSAFVNPTQFNDPRDFETYPRTPDEDARLLDAAGIDVLFVPTEAGNLSGTRLLAFLTLAVWPK